MNNYPSDLLYTRDHGWIRVEGKEGTLGITDFAQKQLGDIVYVEAPKVGDKFQQEEPFGSVESVKAVSELFMPVDGEVTAFNDLAQEEPDMLNTDPYGDGWIIRIRITNAGQLKDLMSPAAYADFVKQEAEG